MGVERKKVYQADGPEIEIHFSRKPIDVVIRALRIYRKVKKPDATHLYIYGGYDGEVLAQFSYFRDENDIEYCARLKQEKEREAYAKAVEAKKRKTKMEKYLRLQAKLGFGPNAEASRAEDMKKYLELQAELGLDKQEEG